MDQETLARQIETVREWAAALEQAAGASLPPQRPLLSETLEALQTTLEELRVAEEELRQQNEELAAAHDQVTAERRRYQKLFELAPDGYLVTDPFGVIRQANRAAAALLGVAPERLAGEPLASFVAARARHDFRTALLRLAAEAKAAGGRGTGTLPAGEHDAAAAPPEAPASREWELQLQPRHGPPVDAAVTVAVAQDETEETVALRWLVRDITERKRIEIEELHRLLAAVPPGAPETANVCVSEKDRH